MIFKFLHNMTYSTCTLYTSYNDSCLLKQGSIYHSICQVRKQKTHLRSNILTEPSAPTEANMSLPPPARLKAISYTYRMKKKMLHVFQLSYQDQNFSQNFTRWQGWISFLLLLKKKDDTNLIQLPFQQGKIITNVFLA